LINKLQFSCFCCDFQPRHHVCLDIEYPELFNNGYKNLQGELR